MTRVTLNVGGGGLLASPLSGILYVERRETIEEKKRRKKIKDISNRKNVIQNILNVKDEGKKGKDRTKGKWR